ncbi:MAG: LacI family DNA-binding transcriptional regulator, partial [Acidiferrobacterales bacterium]|nr:LacI family DNA-binding transcriptional regulator [Acidiferrobacterales bacterium]
MSTEINGKYVLSTSHGVDSFLDMSNKNEQKLIAIAEQWASENKNKRKSTINDVAMLAGVSKKTVSRVINNAPSVKDSTRQDVQTVIKVINYQPD